MAGRLCLNCGQPYRASPVGKAKGDKGRCPRCRAVHMPGNWRAISAGVLERDGHLCQIQLPGCEQTATTTDHVDPTRPPTPDNLRAACRPCNARKG